MQTTATSSAALTSRFTRAIDYARIAHTGQLRKGTQVPYLTHLLGVATLVIEHGGTEDQAIAGLLHDLIEDCGLAHEPVVRAEFGDAVTRIVLACTDGTAEAKAEHTTSDAKRADWVARKRAYLDHLRHASDETLLVSACDKLHNARSIIEAIEDPTVGVRVFDRFTARREGTLAYYHALGEVFTARGVAAAAAYERAVTRMHELSDGDRGSPLGG